MAAVDYQVKQMTKKLYHWSVAVLLDWLVGSILVVVVVVVGKRAKVRHQCCITAFPSLWLVGKMEMLSVHFPCQKVFRQ